MGIPAIALSYCGEFPEELEGCEELVTSILTAILLWVMLELVKGFEHRVTRYFRAKEGAVFKILGYLAVFSILFGSKLLSSSWIGRRC